MADDDKVVSMGPGFHVTSGPAAVYWNPANTASGNYTVSGTFSQACFVLVSGDVECHSTDGVLRPPFGKPMRTAAAAGNAVCATAVDGSLLCQRYEWGVGGNRNIARLQPEATYQARVRGVGGRVRAIAGGTHRFCVLRDDDAVYCWDEYGDTAPERIALPATD